MRGRQRRRRPGRHGRARRDDSRVRAARSSPSPAWPATASASWPRRSPGCARSRRARCGWPGGRCAGATPATRSCHGLAYVPEDRLATGRLPEPVDRRQRGPQVLPPAAGLDAARCCGRGASGELAESLIARFDVKAPGPGTPARQLSGGNLQKVVLGREFSSGPKALVAASPTRGLDVGAIASVHGLLRDAAADGVGILLISEDLDEILVLADRVLVMYEGRVVGEADAGAATVEELGLLMAGGAAGAGVSAPLRIERRLSRPAWLVVAVPVGRAGRGLPDHRRGAGADRPRPDRHLPPALRRGLPGRRRAARRPSSRPRRWSSPGWPPPWPSGCSSSTSAPRGSSTSAPSSPRPAGCCSAGQSAPVQIAVMVLAGIVGGALWALIPAVLRAFLHTNEIITSLMLNYVAYYLMTYLIFDSLSYWRDTSTPDARVFPQGKFLPDAANWPAATIGGRVHPPRLHPRRRRAPAWSGRSTGARASASRSRSSPTRRAPGATPACAPAAPSSPSCASPARWPASAARARWATSATSSTRAGSAGRLRLHRHRGRGPGPLQPVRHGHGGLPARRAGQRRLRPAGAGLPLRPGGGDEGHHPVLRAGQRAAACATGCAWRGASRPAAPASETAGARA